MVHKRGASWKAFMHPLRTKIEKKAKANSIGFTTGAAGRASHIMQWPAVFGFNLATLANQATGVTDKIVVQQIP